MKKIISLYLTVIMLFLICAGCNHNKEPMHEESLKEAPTQEASVQEEPSQEAPSQGEPTQETPPQEEPPLVSTYVLPDNTVYFTADISPEGLMRVYQALEAEPEGSIAVKLSTGEPPKSNYLKPELIKDFVQSLDGTIVECNTAYGGRRTNTEYHLQVAKDHGFTDIADVDIMDSEGEISLPVIGGDILKENFVGSHFTNYDYFVVLSHFKGHEMAGYGGAIKNISIGIASSTGKSWIHSGGKLKKGIGGNQDAFLKSMAEAGKAVAESLNGKILYINVMNRLSIDCDCNGYPAEPDMHDVGILASFDPVALDQACIDFVANDPDGESLMRRIDAKNGLLTLEHAAKIGLGVREYTMVNIDD